MTTADAELAAPVVVLIPCSAGKLAGRHAAGELYTGHMHRAARRAALAWPGAEVLIVSGRYGLLRLGDLVESYEQRIDAAGAVTSAELARQAAELELVDRHVVALLPSAYVAAVRSAGIRVDRDELAGSRGIGDQLGRLARLDRLARGYAELLGYALEAAYYWTGADPELELVDRLARYAAAAVRDDRTGSAHVRDVDGAYRLGPGSSSALVLSLTVSAGAELAAGRPLPELARSRFLDAHRAATPAPAAEQLALAI